MSKILCWAVGCLLLTFGFLPQTLAATNPDLVALAKGRVIKFTGTEHISQPYAYDLDVTTPNPALNFAKVVGQPLKLTVARRRAVAGIIERIEQLGVPGRSGTYRLRIVPAINRLAYRITSRTFPEMDTIDIVNALFDGANISGLEARVNNALSPQVISVQYQESELTYFSRLLEQDGIHYHFELSGPGVKTVLGDSNTAFPALAPNQLVFGAKKSPSITSFSRGLALHSGRTQSGNFNWKTPQVNLTKTAQSNLFPDLVEGIFPAPVNSPQESQRFSAMRLEARITEAQVCKGKSTYTHLQAGHRFVLAGHPRKNFNQSYVITGVEHHGTHKGYHNTFTCLPANLTFRPSPVTPQPKVAGILPGLVVGPQGETTHVDEFGRVRVRFPWRNPAFSDSSDFGDSGWVRVAQIATGTGNTAMWLPEIGDEVAIAFEHGDPRHPVIVGNLYNAKSLPPRPLPDNKTQSVLRSRSIPGGKVPLELFIEAKAGQEHLTLRTGSQFIRISPKEITTSSTIKSPSPKRRTLRPPSKPRTPSIRQIPKR